MAARRLVVVMLVLLAISTLAAALLPPPEGDDQTTTEPPRARKDARPPGGAPRPEQTGMLLVSRIPVTKGQAKTVRIERGDQLRLDVTAPFGADIEIPGLGLIATATPFAPAHFDLLPTRTGRFPVRVVESGSVAGSLLVGRPGSGRCGVSTPATPQGRGSAPPCDRRGRPGSEGAGRSAPRP